MIFPSITGSGNITTWPQFARKVRSKGCSLLNKLDTFPESVLVTGCQRSGTTILSRVITQSEGMFNFRFGRDDELDAALILSGIKEHACSGRYCFQTTYLNECYQEYYQHGDDHKIIWVLRNPYSVVYSLAYNWSRFALNELFTNCGRRYLSGSQLARYSRFGLFGINRLHRACYSYTGKVSQVFELAEKLGDRRIMVIDYDTIARDKDSTLSAVYNFIGLPFKQEYGQKIHTRSINKADKLSARQKDTINRICLPVYEKAKGLAFKP